MSTEEPNNSYNRMVASSMRLARRSDRLLKLLRMRDTPMAIINQELWLIADAYVDMARIIDSTDSPYETEQAPTARMYDA